MNTTRYEQIKNWMFEPANRQWVNPTEKEWTYTNVASEFQISVATARKYVTAIGFELRSTCAMPELIAAMRKVAVVNHCVLDMDILLTDRFCSAVAKELYFEPTKMRWWIIQAMRFTTEYRQGTTAGSYGIFIRFTQTSKVAA
jgi:hypothetical protein